MRVGPAASRSLESLQPDVTLKFLQGVSVLWNLDQTAPQKSLTFWIDKQESCFNTNTVVYVFMCAGCPHSFVGYHTKSNALELTSNSAV